MKLFQIRVRKRRPAPREAAEGGAPRRLRVFVTGATGYIGSAVVRELVSAGHEVTGLTRWAEKTLEIRALGARAVVGDLLDPNSYRRVAAAHDVLIHAAGIPWPRGEAAERGAVEGLLWAAGQGERREDEPPRSVIYTSSCFVLGNTGDLAADESAPVATAPEAAVWRAAYERRVLAANSEAVAAAVIRPGVVYGGRRGLIGAFFASAEEEGAAAFVGDGRNRWSLIHREDLARLYRLVAEQRARGIFHGTDGSAVPVAELARAASDAAGKGGAVRSIPLDEARQAMGPGAEALTLDQVICARQAESLGWRPAHPPFIESVEAVYREWKEAAP